MTTNYAYGSNDPGYLPDNPASVRSTFEDAKQGLIWDLKFWEDYAETEDDAEDYSAAQQDVNLWSTPQTITVAGRAFWIAETDEDADR